MLLQRLLSVALHRVGKSPLVAATGNAEFDPGAAKPGQPVSQLLRTGRQTRHQYLAWNRIGRFVGRTAQFGLLTVELGEELLHQLRLRGDTRLARLLHDPPPLAAHPAAADMENLHRRLQLVVGECHDVGVGAVAKHHRLLLQGTFQRPDVVAQPGRALEIKFGGSGIHLPLQLPDEAIGPPRQEVAEVTHDPAVFLGADPAHARRGALVDVAQQTRTFDLAVPLEHSGRTGARRKHPGQQIEGLSDGPGM